MNRDERLEYVKGLKTSWKFCPRCGKKTIDKAMRICTNCKGVVLFAGIDDGKYANEKMDHYFVWFKYGGKYNWFDKSFWLEQNLIKN